MGIGYLKSAFISGNFDGIGSCAVRSGDDFGGYFLDAVGDFFAVFIFIEICKASLPAVILIQSKGLAFYCGLVSGSNFAVKLDCNTFRLNLISVVIVFPFLFDRDTYLC